MQTIHNSDCPMLLIHKNSEFNNFKTIYVAIENTITDIKILQKIIPFAKLFQSKIRVVHVFTFPDTINSAIDSLKETEKSQAIINQLKIEHQFENISLLFERSENPMVQLEHHLKHDKPDLMVMINQHKSWIERIFHTSITKYLLHQNTTPLLII